MKKRGLLLVFLFTLAAWPLMGQKTLTFEERVDAQKAIERVYYNHRVWPDVNPQPKPPFEKAVPEEIIRKKVKDYLVKSAALDEYWQRPLTGEQLQAEMERMARKTRDPEKLKGLFSVFKNDPYLVVECLVRPALADRLVHNLYANDERFHGELKAKVQEIKRQLTKENFASWTEGEYSEVIFMVEVEDNNEEGNPHIFTLPRDTFKERTRKFPEDPNNIILEETAEAFILRQTLERMDNEFRGAIRVFRKTPFDEWLMSLDIELSEMDTQTYSYHIPDLRSVLGSFKPDSWQIESVPTARSLHTVVWTGTEMIVWGGVGDLSGGRYNPGTDSWEPTSLQNAPTQRQGHTAVWTGSEMIVWGGNYNTGGKYNPQTNTWTATSTVDAPSERAANTAVWTGSEMIIWGGLRYSTYHGDGGRYNPSTDTWSDISITDCPTGRSHHTAVWTGNEMIVWGGGSPVIMNTGGRYNLGADTWSATSLTDAPSARKFHTAIWTGSDMVIWGGNPYTDEGGLYNPSKDVWTDTSTVSVPSQREDNTAVWTGEKMIIWGQCCPK